MFHNHRKVYMPQTSETKNGDPTPTTEAGNQTDIARQEAVSTPTVSWVSGDSRSLPVVIDSSSVSSASAVPVQLVQFPHNLPKKLRIIRAKNGAAYSVRFDQKNRYVLAVGTRVLNNIIREEGYSEGLTLRQSSITDVNHYLQAKAEAAATSHDVWYRVAPIDGGVEVDLGDDAHTRVRITAGRVETVEDGSKTLFYRNQSMLPMARPAATGDIKLLQKYANLGDAEFPLFKGWLTYTLAHPKLPSSKYVILVISGNQGSGKSVLCRLILQLLDPTSIGIRVMPGNTKDLAIAAQNAHVLCYDNVRGFSEVLSDAFCVAATGGAIASRQLYSDAEQAVIYLHVALVLNGIDSFIGQPDLAQRCVTVVMKALKDIHRKSEADMAAGLQADLPTIMRGLFDLIAKVFVHLPNAEVSNPERMVDFSRWLAAMELADGVPDGLYQDSYSFSIKQGQRDSLLDSNLAAAVLSFAEDQITDQWAGTPTELLKALNSLATSGTLRSKGWPLTAIALSKRLLPLQAGLLSQGITVELSRGKHRVITITKSGVKK
jgi:hypothetical protein